MPDPLPKWTRQYANQPGGRPFFFSVTYGKFDALPSLTASKYRSGGVPSGFDWSRYDAENHPGALARFQEGSAAERPQQRGRRR
jgi:hypothetical protein